MTPNEALLHMVVGPMVCLVLLMYMVYGLIASVHAIYVSKDSDWILGWSFFEDGDIKLVVFIKDIVFFMVVFIALWPVIRLWICVYEPPPKDRDDIPFGDEEEFEESIGKAA